MLHFSHDRSNWSSPTPHFKTSPVFLFNFPKFRHYTMLFSKCSTSVVYSLILCPICWWKESLLFVHCCFYHDSVRFSVLCAACIICYHATQTVEVFHILQVWSITVCTADSCPEFLITSVFPTFMSIPQYVLISVIISDMACSTVYCLAIFRRSSVYFVIWITCPPVLKPPNPSRAPLARYWLQVEWNWWQTASLFNSTYSVITLM